MGSLPDSKYIIQTDGYWFVEAHDVDPSKGYISVSAKGIVNGLSNQPNDGCDFGPDSYNPSSTASIPYTQTSGIQEAADYLITQKGGTMVLTDGVFDTTNAPYQSYVNNQGSVQAKVLLTGADPSSNAYISIKIIGQSVNQVTWPEVTAPVSTNGTVFRDTSSGSSTSSFILGIAGFSSAPAKQSNIGIDITGINSIVAHGSGIGVFDFKSCSMLNVGALNFGVDQEWNAGLTEPTNDTQVAINLAGQYDNICNVNFISSSGGYYNTIGVGHHVNIQKISIVGGLNAFYIDNEIHEGYIASANIEYTQNIFNFASTYSGGSVSPLKISHMSIANNYNYANGSAWQNPVNFMNIPSGVTIPWTVYIDLLSYYGSQVPANYYPTASNNLYIGVIQYSNTHIESYFTGNPTISTNPPVSGTAYQNTLPYNILIYLPVYTSTSGTAGNVKASIGASSSSLTQVVNDIVNSGTSSSNPRTIILKVPAGWYYEFTGTTTTFGTAIVVAD